MEQKTQLRLSALGDGCALRGPSCHDHDTVSRAGTYVVGRSAIRRLALVPILVCAIGLASCAARARVTPTVKISPLPISVQGQSLSLRAEARSLTSTSVNLVVYVVVKAPMPQLSVEVTSSDSLLQIHPGACVLHDVAPPTAVHTNGPPYALPTVPLCSLVLSAPSHANSPLLIRVRDANGVDLLQPIETTISFKEGSS